MATIHMDVESCQAVQRSMVSAKEQLSQQSLQMKGQIDGMVGQTFIAPSAEQLKGEVEAWNGKLTQLLEELQTLSDRLNREIVDFMDASQQLAP